jgi:hypothetical protein
MGVMIMTLIWLIKFVRLKSNTWAFPKTYFLLF